MYDINKFGTVRGNICYLGDKKMIDKTKRGNVDISKVVISNSVSLG